MKQEPMSDKQDNLNIFRIVKIINVGIDGFYESLIEQGVPCVHVIWSPPAGGNIEVENILDKLL